MFNISIGSDLLQLVMLTVGESLSRVVSIRVTILFVGCQCMRHFSGHPRKGRAYRVVSVASYPHCCSIMYDCPTVMCNDNIHTWIYSIDRPWFCLDSIIALLQVGKWVVHIFSPLCLYLVCRECYWLLVVNFAFKCLCVRLKSCSDDMRYD